MMDGIAAIQARIGMLDRQIRSVDPTWTGAGSTAGGATDAPDPASFDAVLSQTSASGTDGTSPATTDDLGLGATTPTTPTTTLDPGISLPAGWSAALSAAGNATAASAIATPAIDPALTVVDPVPGSRISQDFGPTSFTGEPPATVNGHYYAHYHDGVDYAAPLGTAVHAIAAGTVIAAGREADGAVIVRIRHADGSASLYGHPQPGLVVRVGDRVAAGEKIGEIGMTGHTTGPHLHLELTRDGKKLDPQRSIATGRLPGATAATPDGSVLATGAASSTAPSGATADALARFDKIAGEIPHAADIRSAAVQAGVDPLLLASLIRAESGFRADAVSPAGALGLAQLMPATARSMGVSDPFDPATNAAAGARYFANNLRIYGRVDLALAAYQAGKGAVTRAGGIPTSPTTHHYIDRILGYWSGYLKDAA